MKISPANGSLLVIAIAILFACNKEEDVPSFIEISEVDLITDQSNEGSASHSIVDAWVFVDDQSLGAFGIPAEVPALYEGTHNVKVIAGIKKDGIADTRIQYPFYKTFSTDLDLVRELNTTIEPVFHYFDGLDIWFEDFEQTGHQFVISSSSDTSLNVVDSLDLVFEGNASGGIFLDDSHVYFRCHSDENFDISAGQPVFLELDHNNNNRMLIGVTFNVSGSSIDVPVLFLNHTTEWEKIYVDLTSAFSSLGASNREFYIEVLKETNIADVKVYIDNVKLIHAGS
jgi:hypothetical protein